MTPQAFKKLWLEIRDMQLKLEIKKSFGVKYLKLKKRGKNTTRGNAVIGFMIILKNMIDMQNIFNCIIR